jgi:hypothetical protein
LFITGVRFDGNPNLSFAVYPTNEVLYANAFAVFFPKLFTNVVAALFIVLYFNLVTNELDVTAPCCANCLLFGL